MGPSSWSTCIRSALHYGRHNVGKVALLTVTTGSAIAFATYLRRQVSVMADTIHGERLQGARKLQTVFMSNSQSICTAFRNLLPKLRSLLSNSAAIDTSHALSRLRERPTDLAEKHALWQQVKVSSITHLASSVYLTALLYSFLSLQMNLLARYNMLEDVLGAPVQALPGGPLAPSTSKAFLDLVLRVVLDETRVCRIVQRIERIVTNVTADMSLGTMPSIDEIEKVVGTVLTKAWSAAQDESEHVQLDDDGSDSRDEPGFVDVPLSVMVHECLFDDMGSDCEHNEQNRSDANYVWLIGECLDLCEVLDFNGFVYNNMLVSLSFVMWRMRKDMETADGYKPVPYARLLARFTSTASTVMTCNVSETRNESFDEGSIGTAIAEKDNMDRWLRKDELATHFGASVFLSGEKDSSGNMSDNSLRTGMTAPIV